MGYERYGLRGFLLYYDPQATNTNIGKHAHFAYILGGPSPNSRYLTSSQSRNHLASTFPLSGPGYYYCFRNDTESQFSCAAWALVPILGPGSAIGAYTSRQPELT